MRVFRYCICCLVAGLMFGIPFAVSKELAKVNDYVIQDKDFLSRIKLQPARGRANLDRERFLRKMIDEELILREAQRANLHEKEDYKTRVENYKRELLVDLYLQQYMNELNTEENQRKFYEENKEKRYTKPEAVRISVINVQSAEEAKEILEKVKAGEDFGELAKKYSKGPAASEGGDFGFRAKKGLRREFADRAFLMKIGEISDPIEAKDGYHIVKVTDRRDGGIAKFEDVKAKVASEYSSKLLEDRILELRKAAKIHIDAAELKNLKIE